MLLPTDPVKKRSTLQLISKISKVIGFVQGTTHDDDVQKDITFAWNRCKESLCKIVGRWPFHGSVRYAYDQRNELRKSLGLELFDSCRQRLVCVQPPILRQPEMTNYFDKKGQLLVIDEDAGIEDADTDFQFSDAVPPAECLECPICPSADLVVFRNSDSLWQHWKSRHANDPRPALFTIHRVQGMKLVSNRNASWTRVPDAMSYHHSDYLMLKMREDIVKGYIKLTPGMFIEIEPGSEFKANGERWFAAVRDGRVLEGDRILAQFCHTNCLELGNEGPQKLTIASILGLGPFKDVPVRQLQASASQTELKSPARRAAPKQTASSPLHTDVRTKLNLASASQTELKSTARRAAPKQLNFLDDAANEPKANPSFLESLETLKVRNVDAFAFAKPFLESIEVQILLRAVCNNSQFLCNPDTAGRMGDALYPTIKIKTSNFVVHNYGDRFDRMYQSHIQKIFHAFPQLNEENRSFFLALGIGAGLDPFLLQCLFRKHAERLLQRQNKNFPINYNQIYQLLDPGGMAENVLSWCWPTLFDETSIFIVDDEHNVTLFESKIGTSKTIILMRNFEGQYLLLQPLQETTCLRTVANIMPFFHANNSDLRCPCISELSNYQVFQNEAVFIAAALPGSECPTAEFDTIWLRSIEACGLEYDSKVHKWTKFPESSGLQKKPGSKNVQETDGSLRDISWDRLRSQMVAAFLVQSSSCCPEQQQLVSHTGVRSCARLNLASPTRPHGPASDHANDIPCLFLDAGSESGKGLYKMMQDERISHVAGVEFQKSWFHISTQIFRNIRQQFSERNYRMPHVTLVHSCMLAQTSILKWLYSSASLVWMNNFVFDKFEYFSSSDPTSTRHPSKQLVPGNTYLSPNAAFNLSQHFDGTTLIAVFDPTKFLSTWNYTPFKPLKVQTTWSTTKEESVTILRHSQHFHISQWLMCFPTSHEAALWDFCTAEWSKVASPITNHIPCASISCLDSINFKCGNTLCWNSLHRLTNRRWLCTENILAYSLLLGKHYTNIHFEHPGLRTDFRTNTRLRRFRDKMISIFCYNINDAHWIAVKFDREQEHITLCDSLAMKHDTIFNDLQILASKLGHSTPFKQIIKKVPNQNNAFDCGVTSCMFMLLMAHDNDATSDWQYESTSVARIFRTRIFADIINQKLTHLHFTKS